VTVEELEANAGAVVVVVVVVIVVCGDVGVGAVVSVLAECAALVAIRPAPVAQPATSTVSASKPMNPRRPCPLSGTAGQPTARPPAPSWQEDRHSANMTAMPPEHAITDKPCAGSVADVTAALTGLVEDRGMKVFAVIDHSGEAASVGLDLRDTKVVLFGSPAAGTPVMQAAPLAALDLPLRILVWDNDGQTMLSYTAPPALAARYGLPDALGSRLAGIDQLTDALTTAGSSEGEGPGV
jgi:uncharacterized protein (DUF302 family)